MAVVGGPTANDRVGGGSICITRAEKGIGRGQALAVEKVAEARREHFKATGEYIPICSDGGNGTAHEFLIALAFGADYIMGGKIFAATLESPTEFVDVDGVRCKRYWGEGSYRANGAARYGDTDGTLAFAEGVETAVPYVGTVEEFMTATRAKLCATLISCGSGSLAVFRKNARIERISPASMIDTVQRFRQSNNDLQSHSRMTRPRLALLASGGGANVRAIIDACEAGVIDAEPALVIVTDPRCRALEFAEGAGIPTIAMPKGKRASNGDLDVLLHDALVTFEIDLVVLAGWLSLIGHRTVNAFVNRIVNVHPSLLPAHGGKGCYGARVHESVLNAGDTRTGATVHFVDEHYDNGKIIEQVALNVRDTDTVESLTERTLLLGIYLYITVLGKLVKNWESR